LGGEILTFHWERGYPYRNRISSASREKVLKSKEEEARSRKRSSGKGHCEKNPTISSRGGGIQRKGDGGILLRIWTIHTRGFIAGKESQEAQKTDDCLCAGCKGPR